MTPPSAASTTSRETPLLIATCLKDLSQSSNPSAPVPHSAARADAAPKTAAITAAKTKAFKSLPRIGSSGFITIAGDAFGSGGEAAASQALVASIAPNPYQKDPSGETASSACLMQIARGGQESENAARAPAHTARRAAMG